MDNGFGTDLDAALPRAMQEIKMIGAYWYGDLSDTYLATQLALGSDAPGFYSVDDLDVYSAGTDMIELILYNR